MHFAASYHKSVRSRVDTAVFTIFDDKNLSPAALKLDEKAGGIICSQLKRSDLFKGKAGQTMVVSLPEGCGPDRVILLGLGDGEKLDAAGCESAGGKLFTVLQATGAIKVHLYADFEGDLSKVTAEEAAARFAAGLRLRSYRFDKYKSPPDTADEDDSARLEVVEVVCASAAKAAKIDDDLSAAVAGVFFARDLVNEPPNELYPDSFAKIIKAELVPLGVEVEILDEKKMQKLGFHAHLAVGMGSSRPPRAVIMRWNCGGKKKTAGKNKGLLAFVGKGVTFDTGGINLKPTAGLESMKMDMGGAAAVVGLMKTLALRKSKASVVGIVGLAENMPSHEAYRPSDIINSLSGKTIEVMNTDAEGRLVLADCLTYVQRTDQPRLVIDLATLTGAMMVALGYDYCGTFVNDNELWAQMEEASGASGEKLWRMPLDDSFKKDMESTIADLRSLGGTGSYGGACTAAGFLSHFIEDGRPWAHMDIAGTAWIKADRPTCPKPATGFGVRVLDRLIASHYE